MFIATAFNDGGVFMYFILAFAILTLGFIVERASALYFRAKDIPADFRSRLLDFSRHSDWQNAERLCTDLAPQQPIARIAREAIRVRARAGGEEELQARMDERLNAEIGAIDKRTGFLAMFGNVATLVGLLGTIGGMIVSFAGVAEATPADRATMLSKGISHALNCTAFGLLVAIPALIFFAVLQNRTDQMVKALVGATTQIYHDLLFSTETARATNSVDRGASGRERNITGEIRA